MPRAARKALSLSRSRTPSAWSLSSPLVSSGLDPLAVQLLSLSPASLIRWAGFMKLADPGVVVTWCTMCAFQNNVRLRACRACRPCKSALNSLGELRVSTHSGHMGHPSVGRKSPLEEKVPETGALSSARLFSSHVVHRSCRHITVTSGQNRHSPRHAATRYGYCLNLARRGDNCDLFWNVHIAPKSPQNPDLPR